MLPVEPLALPERCEGVVVLREAFPFQPVPDRAWTSGAAEGCCRQDGPTSLEDSWEVVPTSRAMTGSSVRRTPSMRWPSGRDGVLERPSSARSSVTAEAASAPNERVVESSGPVD